MFSLFSGSNLGFFRLCEAKMITEAVSGHSFQNNSSISTNNGFDKANNYDNNNIIIMISIIMLLSNSPISHY